MKAIHINQQGRQKPYSLIQDQLEVEASSIPDIFTKPHFNLDPKSKDTYDFDDGLFHFRLWQAEGNSAQLTHKYGYEYAVYDDLLLTLWDSPMARSLINFAARRDWSLSCEALEDGAYDLNVEERVLTLNTYNLRLAVFEKPGYFRQALTLGLIRGLRDLWHVECRQPYEMGLSIESILFLERVRAADCDVIALLASWELRSQGNAEVWRHLIGTPEGDLAMCFSKALDKVPSKNFNGGALIEAFHEWFESPLRVAACDHQTLEMIDESLEENFDSARLLYGSKCPCSKFIESLSRLPNKSQYLKGYGADLLENGHFFDLEDDVNTAHFLQIKRELKSIVVAGVAFRNADLAAKIFPEEI